MNPLTALSECAVALKLARMNEKVLSRGEEGLLDFYGELIASEARFRLLSDALALTLGRWQS